MNSCRQLAHDFRQKVLELPQLPQSGSFSKEFYEMLERVLGDYFGVEKEVTKHLLPYDASSKQYRSLTDTVHGTSPEIVADAVSTLKDPSIAHLFHKVFSEVYGMSPANVMEAVMQGPDMVSFLHLLLLNILWVSSCLICSPDCV